MATKKTAIRLVKDGRFFLDWHKSYQRQGDRAVFHPSDMKVFIYGVNEVDCDLVVQRLQKRGHVVKVVEVEWSVEKKNFVEVQGTPGPL